MGEEFVLLNGLAAEQAWGVFEEIWDLICCRLSAPIAHRRHEQYFQRTGKKKKSSIVQPPGGRVKHQCEKKKITVLSTNVYEEINLVWKKWSKLPFTPGCLLCICQLWLRGSGRLRMLSIWGLTRLENNRNKLPCKRLSMRFVFNTGTKWHQT